MAFYVVITNAYANEVSVRNDLPMHIVTIPENEVTDFISYVRGSIHYAIQQLIPSARLHCIHQRQLGQVTSVAKQRDPAAQSKRFGNVD
jgi:hypothetical protein